MAADQNVAVKFTGDASSVEKAAKESGSSIQSLTGAVKTFAVAAGAAFVAKKVIDFGISAVEAFEVAEASAARVTQTLKLMGPAAEANAGKINALAQAAVKLGFDDEQAAESITRFYQATGDLTRAQELNATAMDLARAKNIDLATATNLVNMALSGNGRVLKQYQIELDETKSPLEQVGQLHDKVRGQAEAFAETLPGKIAALSETCDNVKQSIGGALAQGLAPFVDKLTVFLNDPQFIAAITSLANVFGKVLAVALDVVVKSVIGLKMAFEDMVAGWEEIFDIINHFRN